MNLDEARALSDKLNLGVGKAKTLSAYETKLRDTENPDGGLLDASVERVNERELPLGHVGPARACCDAPGDEHEPHCVMFKRD